jgi:cation transport regulator
MPLHAQDIYRAAFNNAFARYGADREAIAHRIAWAAVKKCYVQRGGFWFARTRRGVPRILGRRGPSVRRRSAA